MCNYDTNEILKKINNLQLEIKKVNEIADSEIERYTKTINEYRENKLLELNIELNHSELLLKELLKKQIKKGQEDFYIFLTFFDDTFLYVDLQYSK